MSVIRLPVYGWIVAFRDNRGVGPELRWTKFHINEMLRVANATWEPARIQFTLRQVAAETLHLPPGMNAPIGDAGHHFLRADFQLRSGMRFGPSPPRPERGRSRGLLVAEGRNRLHPGRYLLRKGQ